MSDLADIAFEIAGDLPASARKVIDTAVAHGWGLNPPGMTMTLRLNHPTDELAAPVYVTWTVGRTPKGRLSFKHMSCGTASLVPLSSADLLEYLADPTTILMSDEDIDQADAVTAAKAAKKADEKRPPWDVNADTVTNLGTQLGARVLKVEATKADDILAEQRQMLRIAPVRPGEAPKSPSRPLRVQAPGKK